MASVPKASCWGSVGNPFRTRKAPETQIPPAWELAGSSQMSSVLRSYPCYPQQYHATTRAASSASPHALAKPASARRSERGASSSLHQHQLSRLNQEAEYPYTKPSRRHKWGSLLSDLLDFPVRSQGAAQPYLSSFSISVLSPQLKLFIR